MKNKELVDYVIKTTAMGYPNDKIKQVLLQTGYKEKDINIAFKQSFPSSNKAPFLGFDKNKALYFLAFFAILFSAFAIINGYAQTYTYVKSSFVGAVGFVVFDLKDLTHINEIIPEENLAVTNQNIFAVSNPSKGIYLGSDSTNDQLNDNLNCNTKTVEQLDWCYFKLARHLTAQKYCSEINNFELRHFCNTIFTEQGTDCNKITDLGMRQLCILDK